MTLALRKFLQHNYKKFCYATHFVLIENLSRDILLQNLSSCNVINLGEKQPVQETSYLQLESEVSRLTSAFATRNSEIGRAVIASLRSQLTLRDVAGIVIVSLEQVVRVDPLAFCWAVEQTIPGYVMREIRRMTSMCVYKRLIAEGLYPGEDFSMDSKGAVMLSDRAKDTLFA